MVKIISLDDCRNHPVNTDHPGQFTPPQPPHRTRGMGWVGGVGGSPHRRPSRPSEPPRIHFGYDLGDRLKTDATRPPRGSIDRLTMYDAFALSSYEARVLIFWWHNLRPQRLRWRIWHPSDIRRFTGPDDMTLQQVVDGLWELEWKPRGRLTTASWEPPPVFRDDRAGRLSRREYILNGPNATKHTPLTKLDRLPPHFQVPWDWNLRPENVLFPHWPWSHQPHMRPTAGGGNTAR